MNFRSAKTFLVRLIQFLVAFCILAELYTFHVQAQSHVNVTLHITIKDKDTQSPVKMVEISIPRQGTNSKGSTLQEIKQRLPEGEFLRPDTDFELTGNPHKLIIVKAEGYKIGSPIELADDILRQANSKSDRTLEIPLELTKLSATNTNTGSQNTNTSTDSPTPTPPGPPIINVSTIRGWVESFAGSLNYAFWVLGLAVTCLLGVWILLALLARILQKDSLAYQRRILRFAPLLAKGVIRPFGYRLSFSLWLKGERNPCEEALRIINNSLSTLLNTNAAKSGSVIHLNDIKDNLAILAGPNKATAEVERCIADITVSLEKFCQRSAPDDGKTPNPDLLKPASKEAMLEALMEFKSDLLKEFKPDLLIATSVSGVNAGATVTTSSIKDTLPNLRDCNDQQRIKTLYRRLLDHQLLDCKPIYLEVVMKGSPLGKFADDNVYLSQVGSSQAPFVLLTSDEGDGAVGWVFPNPAQAYDRSTLKDVFPGLNEAQFNDAKEQIEPAVVRKAEDGRWMVDRNAGSLAM